MSNHPFVVAFELLPQTLPIFPLPGAIVMPRGELPLNIFEPRYLNMVHDAIASNRMIGMIQPDEKSDEPEKVCQTGCAGRITQYQETMDGRIELVLTGVCRFDVELELPTTRGYRLIQPDWSRFRQDYVDHGEELQPDHGRLMQSLEQYLETSGLEADIPQLRKLPTERLIDALAMALPFSQQSKQMLLETVAADARLNQFIALLDGEIEVPDSVTRH